MIEYVIARHKVPKQSREIAMPSARNDERTYVK
jgi:hypothetical protein